MLPTEYSLSAAYPNPFNPVTNLGFALPQDDNVTLVVYNLGGKVVETLVSNSYFTAGYHSVIWNASHQSSGVYFVKMISGENTFTQKIMLVK
jgi:flagellar hook assembly protein FlgD